MYCFWAIADFDALFQSIVASSFFRLRLVPISRSLSSHPPRRCFNMTAPHAASAPAEGQPPAAAPAGTEPPTKSALKKLEKEAALAAKKALKKAQGLVPPPPAGQGKKKEKVVKEVVKEPDFIEVPAGQFKGALVLSPSRLTQELGRNMQADAGILSQT